MLTLDLLLARFFSHKKPFCPSQRTSHQAFYPADLYSMFFERSGLTVPDRVEKQKNRKMPKQHSNFAYIKMSAVKKHPPSASKRQEQSAFGPHTRFVLSPVFLSYPFLSSSNPAYIKMSAVKKHPPSASKRQEQSAFGPHTRFVLSPVFLSYPFLSSSNPENLSCGSFVLLI